MKATWQEFNTLLRNVRAKSLEVVEVRDPNFFEAGTSGIVDADPTPDGKATPASDTQAAAIGSADDNEPATGTPEGPVKDASVGRFIGVTPLYDRFSAACQQASTTQFPTGITSSLKRDALLFDSLTVTDWSFVGGSEFIWSLPKKGTVVPNQQHIVGNSVYVPQEMWGSCIGASTVKKEVAAEINWLFEHGVLQHSPHFELPDSVSRFEVDLLQQFVREKVGSISFRDEGWASVSRAILPLNRLVCMKLEHGGKCTAVPIFSYSSDADALAGSCLNKGLGDVVEVVIQAMPQPDELTPWERIIEFRQDQDAKAMALGLRRWMRAIANDCRPRSEIDEELEWLLSEYERYMRLHRMKVNTGVVETVVTLTAQFIENIAKMKLSQAAGLLFVAKHRKIALLEAELHAPGREVAYISKARVSVGTPSRRMPEL